MYSCVPVGDASGGHSSIEGSRERMMRHLCICLHKSRHTHNQDTTSDAPATPFARASSMLVAAAAGKWMWLSAALQRPKLDLPYKRMRPNLEGPARVSSSPT